jgi:Glycoside-hydrolase family GH114
MRVTRPVIMMATVAVTFALAGTGLSPGLPAAAAAAVPPTAGATTSGPAASVTSATTIPAPTAQGRLAIAGHLRDGGLVRATGLRWRPGLLPRGDKLLSFEVSYSWRACAVACVTAADSSATPFAARQYRVGHADSGRRLRVTETATEIVETDPATFAFSDIRSSASFTTKGKVAAYRAGRRPVTEFVNGTPERQTASDAEYFQVDPPHFAAAGRTPSLQYRVDAGAWRAMPASRVFYTGKLGVGPHRVAVRTSNAAGATVIGFGWHVVPMPAPVPCQPRPSRAHQSRAHRSHAQCWYPPHLNSAGKPMRWDWQIGRVTPLERTGKRAVDIYDIDGFLTTRAEVSHIHAHWQAATLAHPKLICYLDLAWEDYRPDGSPGGVFPAAALGKVYFGYSQERWVDFRQLDALKPMLDERIAMCARKGFDAVELDDIDSFDPPSTTGFHLTPGDAQNYLAYAFNQIHRDGMTALWKNSPYLTSWGRNYADGAIVEECYVYRQCLASQLRGSSQYGITCTRLTGATPCGWDDFSTDRTSRQPTGKWVGEAEYGADHFVCDPGQACSGRRSFAAFCRAVYSPSYGFAAVKFDVDLDGGKFYPCPTGT